MWIRRTIMGTALFKIKLMPESPEIDLIKLQNSCTEAIAKVGGKVTGFEENPIAFGLVALIVNVRLSETLEGSLIEDALRNIEGISSIDIIDYRRAIE